MGMSIEKYLDHIQQSDSMPPETNPFRTDRPLAQKARTVAAAASRGDPISTSPDRSIQEVPVPQKLPAKDATPPLTRPVPGPSPAAAIPAEKKKKKAAKATPTPTGPVAEPTPAAIVPASKEKKRKSAKSAILRAVDFVDPAASAAATAGKET